MNLDSKQLEAFNAVITTGSFTKAADTLCITQSALSQRIHRLEQQLGLLFIREKKKIYATELAHKLATYCHKKSLLDSEFLAERAPNKTDSLKGIVRFGGISSALKLIIIKRLTPLFNQNPLLQLEMHEYEERDIERALFTNKVDYIVSSRCIHQCDIQSIQIATEVNVLVESKQNQTPHRYLDHDGRDETTFMFLKQQSRKRKNISMHYLDNIHLIIEACRAGLGRAVLPIDCLENYTDLVEVENYQPLEIPIYLSFLDPPFQTKLQQAVCKVLTETI